MKRTHVPGPRAAALFLAFALAAAAQDAPPEPGSWGSWSSAGDAQPFSAFGLGLGWIGDVTGDGYDDLAVIQARAQLPEGQAPRIFLYAGGPAGPMAEPFAILDGPVDPSPDEFPPCVTSAGDVNGDGMTDILASFPSTDAAGLENVGEVRLYAGGPADQAPPLLWMRSPERESGGTLFGRSIAAVGDVNGDGYADVAISEPRLFFGPGQGAVHVYWGSPEGLTGEAAQVIVPASDGPGRFGESIAAGDFNGDGRRDLLIGAPYDINGSVFVHHGIDGGFSDVPNSSVAGDRPLADFGGIVAAGDLDNDGYDDVIAHHPGPRPLRIILGRPKTLSTTVISIANPAGWALEASLAMPGDLNGDGYDDIAVQAYSVGGDEVVVQVFAGSPDGPGLRPALILASPFGGTSFGISIAGRGNADGDGFDDLLVGATDARIDGELETGAAHLAAGWDFGGPSIPTALGQRALPGGEPLPLGGAVVLSELDLTAIVADPEGDRVRLEIEVRPTPAMLWGSPTGTSSLAASGGPATIRVGSLAIGSSYHWRARTVASNGQASAWVCFGTHPDNPTEVDFRRRSNSAPQVLSLRQVEADGRTLPVGAFTLSELIRIEADLADGEGDESRMEIEFRPVGSPFRGEATHSSDSISSGGIASIEFPLAAGAAYHWQVRGADRWEERSPWQSFGSNDERQPDIGRFGGSTGASTCAQGAAPAAAWIAAFLAAALAVPGRRGGRWLVLLLLSSTALAGGGALLLPAVSGTVGLFPFDEADGTKTDEASGKAIQGTMNGPGTLRTTGIDGGAIDFQGYGSNVSLSPAVTIGSTWTIQGWAQFPLTSGLSTYRYFACSSSDYYGHVSSTGDVLGVWAGSWYPSGFDLKTLTGWHLLTAVGSGGRTVFYIDATMVGTSYAQVTSPIIYIGGFGSSPYIWGGAIDGVRILNVARSAADVAADANAINAPPPAPTSAGQFDSAGTPIPPGGTVRGSVVVSANVTGRAATQRLEVEVEAAGTAFDGAPPFVTGADTPSGSKATVVVPVTAPGPYHWRVRSVDSNGASPWTSFGSNPLGTDLVVAVNLAPTALQAGLAQGDAAVIAGQVVADSEGIRFWVSGGDPESDDLRLQVEVRPLGTPFSGDPNAEGPSGPAGEPAACMIELPRGDYRWQYRLVDAYGAASPWTGFGSDPALADFSVAWAGSSGGGFCGGSSSAAVACWIALAALVALTRGRGF